MNKSKLLLPLFIVWVMVVSAVVLIKNPYLFQLDQKFQEKIVNTTGVANVQNFIFQDRDADSPATFEYRGGPKRQGFYESEIKYPLVIGFESEQINFSIHSASKSAPAVDESGIYVGADSSWMEAFDFTGKRKWSYFTNKAQRGLHGTASLDQDSVYIGSYNGFFYRFDKKTGKLIWAMKMLGASGCSSILEGEFLYICTESGTDGYLTKLKRKTGEMVWNTPTFGEQVHSSPALDVENRIVTIGTNRGDFNAYDADTGEKKWTIAVGQPVKGTAAIYENQLCFSSWSKELICLDRKTGEVIHRYPLDFRSQSSAAIDPELGIAYVYAGSFPTFALHAFDLKEKKELWKRSLLDNASGTSPVLTKAKNGRKTLWGVCSNKSFCAFDPKTGKELWSISLGKIMSSVPTIYQNRFYLALDGGPVMELKEK